MNLKRISEFGLSMLLSLSSLLVIAVPKAHAATVTWDGEGANNNFSTATNWAGDVVPQNGDDIVFNNETDVGDQTYTNDISGLVLANITLNGNASSSYTIAGNAITLSGGIISNSADGFLDISLDISLSTNPVVNTGTGSVKLSGVLSGTGNITINGTGFLELTGNNTFTGTTTVTGGNVTAGSLTALGAVSAGTIVDGGLLHFLLPTADKMGTLTEPVTINAGISSGGLDIGAACGFGLCTDSDITFAGALVIAKNISVFTSGKVTITGPITGNFTISLDPSSTGTLVINSSANGSATPNGTQGGTAEAPYTTNYADSQPNQDIVVKNNETAIVTGSRADVLIQSGGTLKGTGTVKRVDIFNGAKLSPGLSPGCLSTGDLFFAEGSTYEFEVGGTEACTGYDQTKVTGTVSLGNGTLSTILFNDYKPKAGEKYTIIDNDAADALAGTFLNLAQGATFTADGYVYSVSYVGGDGNDVVITVVSVPASPNTGFQILANNPLITLGATVLAAGAMIVLAKKYNRVTSTR